MAYSDYGAFVWKNGKRMKDYEDAEISSIEGLDCVHGLIKDNRIEVLCYKQGLPVIFLDGKRVEGYEGSRDWYNYGDFSIDLSGYCIAFHSGYDVAEPYEVRVTCPNGDQWICRYDYGYGAGFEEFSLYNLLSLRIKDTKLELEDLSNDEDNDEEEKEVAKSYLEGLLEGLEFARSHSKMVEYKGE